MCRCRPSVVVGESDDHAARLAAGYGLWVRSIGTGAGAIEFPPPEVADAHVWSDDDRALVKDRIDTQLVGSLGPWRTNSSNFGRRPGPTSWRSRPSRISMPTGCAPTSYSLRNGTGGNPEAPATPFTAPQDYRKGTTISTSPRATLHLTVALEGTGWHPASWRERTARRASCSVPDIGATWSPKPRLA